MKVKTHLRWSTDGTLPDEQFQAKLQRGAIDEALRDWNTRWEQSLIRSCEATGATTTSTQSGRTCDHHLSSAQATQLTHQQEHLPLQLRQLQTTLRMATTLHAHELADENLPDKLWHQAVSHRPRRAKLSRRLQQLHAYHTTLEAELDLEHAIDHLRQQHRGHLDHYHAQQRKRWQQRINNYSSACRYLVAQPVRRLDRLALPDGEILSDVAAMDDHLRAFWQDQAMKADQDLDEMRDHTRVLINSLYDQGEPYTLPHITATMLSDALAGMRKRASPGPGMWRVAELQTLPPLRIAKWLCFSTPAKNGDSSLVRLRSP